MQEESSMDKKGASKANGETKPQQEFGVNKYNRQPKRREYSYNKYENKRGFRGRPFPRGRGQYADCRPYPDNVRSYNRNSFPAEKCGRGEYTEKSRQVRDVLTDVKTKKQNLNHLLNFTIAPRHSEEYVPPARRTYNRRPKYNKEHYLQANCQFVVRADADYSVYSADPDLLVEWELIEQVRLHSDEIPSCPICLYPPKAAKITRCGHIYCSCCILHYLALSDKSWRKCPICYESVTRKDLKSVMSITHPQLSVGDDITFCLMRRERDSMIAVPVQHYSRGITSNIPTLDAHLPTAAYSKLILASPQQVISSIIEREKQELETQLKQDGDEPESCFIEQALGHIEERTKQLRAARVEEQLVESVSRLQVNTEDKDQLSSSAAAITYESAFDDVQASADDVGSKEKQEEEEVGADVGAVATEPEVEITSEDLDISKLQKTVNQPKATFYFYQAIDGQLLFLHALNVHMLVAEYGSLDRCPQYLTGKAVELEGTSMTELLRSKLRYISHLSVTTNFQVAEIQLSPPQIHQKTVDMFRGEIEKRKRNRARRARSEKKRERRIHHEEMRKWGHYPPNHNDIGSLRHFPDCRVGDSINVGVKEEVEEPIENSQQQSEANTNTPMSFAQMLREGKIKSNKKSNNEKPEPQIQKQSVPERERRYTSESDAEDWVPPPQYQQSFSDAIQQAAVAEHKVVSTGEGGKKNKKKNKVKQQLLFSTSMARGK